MLFVDATVWMHNCVGYKNQKFFVLFLIYVAISMFLFMIVSWPLMRELLDRKSLFRYVYSYGLTVLVLSIAVAVFCAVVGMGGFIVFQSAKNITSVEMAQRQTYKKMVKQRALMLQIACQRHMTEEEIAAKIPPIHESFVPVDYSLGSTTANLHDMFGTPQDEPLFWSFLPHFCNRGGNTLHIR